MKFREHGHDKPILQLEGRAALEAYLKAEFAPWPSFDHIDLGKLKTEPYGVFYKQGPSGWSGKVWLLSLPGYGVVGYLDQPLTGGADRAASGGS